jgi:hypothetical protein
MPLRAYRHDAGWLLGRTFLDFTHTGRSIGQPHNAVAMVLHYDGATHEAVICAAWGDQDDDDAVRQFVHSHPFVAFRPAVASPTVDRITQHVAAYPAFAGTPANGVAARSGPFSAPTLGEPIANHAG